jgi:CheY-like chemotaxis protein
MLAVKNLCVVDDDMIYQFAVKLTIQRLELAKEVLTFPNGEQAKSFMEANKQNPDALPDVILLDINMPVMDGWEFLDWFAMHKTEFSKKIPVFMVSSSIDWRDIEKAKSYPEVIDYLSKPMTDGSFYEIVSRME